MDTANRYFEDDRIRLRPLEPEDLDFVYRIENNSSHWMISSTTSPVSRYSVREYIEQARHQSLYEMKELRLVVEDKHSLQRLGLIDLYEFDLFHLRAAVGIEIETTSQRQGIATRALTLLQSYAFDFLHLHQLYAFVPQDNEASLGLFQKNGFLVRGCLTDWLRQSDKFVDVYCLSRCKE